MGTRANLRASLSTLLKDILGHPRITLGTALSGSLSDPRSSPACHLHTATLLFVLCSGLALTRFSASLPFQSLQNSSYNHFAAIYYLLLERLKEHRSTPPSARPGPARQQRPRSSDHSSLEVRGNLLKPTPVSPE